MASAARRLSRETRGPGGSGGIGVSPTCVGAAGEAVGGRGRADSGGACAVRDALRGEPGLLAPRRRCALRRGRRRRPRALLGSGRGRSARCAIQLPRGGEGMQWLGFWGGSGGAWIVVFCDEDRVFKRSKMQLCAVVV